VEGLTTQAVVADKATDSGRIHREHQENWGSGGVPPRDNRPQARHYDRHLYKDRNLVERFFNRIKQFRRIATRYDKLDRSYLAFLSLVCTFVWLL
jgi:transposase